ncbi:hypothetical protein EDM76_13805 [bacterium]|nr:MAG: hypothetical protein EDM76_13805 [bacterium]
MGTYYVQAGETAALAWGASIAMGCTVTMILVVNNLRDIHTDRAAGKTTLAVVLGVKGTRAWFSSLLAGAFTAAGLCWPLADASPAVLLVALSAPFAAGPLRAVLGGAEGRDLNATLKATARFHLLFGLLFAAGLALS